MNNGWPLKIYYESISRKDGEESKPRVRERDKTKVSHCMENLQVFPYFYGCRNTRTHIGIYRCLDANVRSIRAHVSDFERWARASTMPSTSTSDENDSWKPNIIQFLNREGEFFYNLATTSSRRTTRNLKDKNREREWERGSKSKNFTIEWALQWAAHMILRWCVHIVH